MAAVDWVLSPRGVQSALARERAKSRLVGERHGLAAAGRRQVVPRVNSERGKLEGRRPLDSRAVTCHRATATALLGSAGVGRMCEDHEGAATKTQSATVRPSKRCGERRAMVASAGVFWLEG